ncbi:MAG: hypothetical protein PHR30_16645 [Gallionellaceae bacterium]|nr:hypothetical protein [Gallionellaceae bacterium]
MTMIDFFRAGCQGPPPDEIAQLGAILTREAQQPPMRSATGLLPHTKAMRRLGDCADPPSVLNGQRVNADAARTRHARTAAAAASNRPAIEAAGDELHELLCVMGQHGLTPCRCQEMARIIIGVFLAQAEGQL